jgi:hypothetical protein
MATADRVTLADLLKRGNQPLAKGIVQAFLKQAPFFDRIPVVTTGMLSGKGRRRTSLPTLGNRLINEDFTTVVSHTEQYQWALSLYGAYIDIDTEILSEPGGTEEQKEQITAATDGLAQQIANDLFNGDSATNPKAFDGLKVLMSTVPSRMTIDAAGMDLDSAADIVTNSRALLNLVRTGIQRVQQGTGGKPDVIFAGDDMLLVLSQAAMGNATTSGWWSSQKDQDRNVETLFGIPVEATGFNNAQTQILAADHDGSARTSIYLVRLGAEYFHLKQKAALYVGKPKEMDDLVTDRIKIEWALAPYIKNDYAVCRIKGFDITP